MKKALKWAGIILLVAFIIIQFIPKNYPENKPVDDNDIITFHQVPENVATILKTSCYDCHSNQVSYPWYSHVAPVSFLLSHDINEGKDELNFSEWGNYETRRMIKKLDELTDEVEEDEMPLPIYTVIHGNAILNQEQKETLIDWANSLMEEIVGE